MMFRTKQRKRFLVNFVVSCPVDFHFLDFVTFFFYNRDIFVNVEDFNYAR